MKIHVLSDLHHEFGWRYQMSRDIEPDVVVLAGDIDRGAAGVQWAVDTFTMPVIYVAGNHEFYRESLNAYSRMHEAAAGTNVHVLQNESVVIDGVRFFGATLWTDFALYGNVEQALSAAQFGMNDYRLIRDRDDRLLRATGTRAEFLMSRAHLGQTLGSSAEPVIVVTHHGPHRFSVNEARYGVNDLNAAYASDMSAYMEGDSAPPLWIHGHTHHSVDYTVGQTRVVANCHGYPKAFRNVKGGDISPENRAFDFDFIVEYNK